MREKSTISTTDNEREKENVLGIVVGKRQCVSNMGRARALCWITIIGYWNLRPQVATAQEMIRKGKHWLQENQDKQLWKHIFSKGGLVFDGQNNQPLWKKTYEGKARPKLHNSNVCIVYVNIWFSPKQRVSMPTTARCLPIILFVYPPFLICRLFIWEEKHASLHVQDLAKDVSTIVVFKVFLFSYFLPFFIMTCERF